MRLNSAIHKKSHDCRRLPIVLSHFGNMAALFAALMLCVLLSCFSPFCREAMAENAENTCISFRLNAVLTAKGSVNLREKPSFDAPVIGVMTRSDTLRVVGQTGDFFEGFLADTHCYVYAKSVKLSAERIVTNAAAASAVKADIKLEDYVLSDKEKPNLTGTVSAETPIQSVAVYIYDMRALEVEAFCVHALPSPSAAFDVSELNASISSKRLCAGEKLIYLVVNDGASETVAFEQEFYVLGAAKEPVNMTNLCKLTVSNGSPSVLLDTGIATAWKPERSVSFVSVELPKEPVAALCTLSWQVPPREYTVTLYDDCDNVISEKMIQSGFCLEAIELPQADDESGAVRKIRIQTNDYSAIMTTLRVYEAGRVSNAVQRWQPLADKLDIMVVSAHQDDEFLFYGGTIPQSAARNKAVGVVYMANCGRYRYVEALDALWTAGLKTHPVFLNLVDSRVETLAAAEKLWAPKEPLKELVRLIRRYRPNVIVTHDFNGEYGHYQHIYTALLVEQAVEKAADGAFDPESAEEYGTWSTPKLYIHLSDTNPITVDWNKPVDDSPITPYLLAEVAYDRNQSQQKYFSFSEHGALYDNRRFGLVHSTVGEDIERNDFFENIEEDKQ